MLALRRRFDFERDAFAFPNELLCEYRVDPASGEMRLTRRTPRPRYVLRCFVLAKAARQFLYHARFEPAAPPCDDATYRRLIQAVLRGSVRRPSPEERAIVIPGFAGLRELSAAREVLVKAACGGAWRSYLQRSHWRMIFPMPPAHQERTAVDLLAALQGGDAPIVHVLRFPSLTINHVIVLFDGARTASGAWFLAYDPNDPERPARLAYDRGGRRFSLPANHYWRGGPLGVFEIARRWYL
ncbi:MAG TPA: hypothetical protein VEH80_02430 [Candidatus Bathyarchaeia archaeon]|nr:hypothetical protein [Candidatus Bathyarchaeia archaeon]